MHTNKLLDILLDYCDNKYRKMPWRIPEKDSSFDPHKILVSEIMLQQTQVSRVIPKFDAFVQKFPSSEILASAQLSEVLAAWSGLGYNRRAKYLHDAAKQLAGKPFPHTIEELTKLKGVGVNTAAAVLTYSFNQRHIFVETNIRSVILYHNYADSVDVSDADILSKVSKILEEYDARGLHNYRKLYWAFMDYGSYLKQTGNTHHRQAKNYVKQSKFEGSARQARGQIIRILQGGSTEASELLSKIDHQEKEKILQSLNQEGLIVIHNNVVSLP